MTTRFCPSLNGSLHLGHLWMAYLNHRWAKQESGHFILRFDDLAPIYAGEDTSRQSEFANEGQEILARAGVIADQVTWLSSHEHSEFPEHVGGQNFWLRPPSLEGWDGTLCSPRLVAARVAADIAEGVTHVIRGEELTPELQLYEYLTFELGAAPRHLIFVPRLRVLVDGEIQTISKTYGNLQLRDLYELDSPRSWVERVAEVCLFDPAAPISMENINPDPIIEVAALCRV